MQWVIQQEGTSIYWKTESQEDIGVSGTWVVGLPNATKYSDKQRDEYRSDKGELPTCFKWKCVTRRHDDALLIQSAVNPAGIARSLHEAFREVIAEGGDTRAQQEDPACRLILHQLAYLLGMTGGYDLSEYRKYTEFCEAQVAAQKEDSK